MRSTLVLLPSEPVSQNRDRCEILVTTYPQEVSRLLFPSIDPEISVSIGSGTRDYI